MVLDQALQTSRLLLRSLVPADANENYLSWTRDPAVTQYLELRFVRISAPLELAQFIESANASTDTLMLGIFLKIDGRHIGNIKLGPIVRNHARSELGFLIGDKSCWGQGYAAEAIRAVSDFAIDVLGLDKVTAGCYEVNYGSTRALVKAGFVHEATIPSHVILDGRRIASLLYGRDR